MQRTAPPGRVAMTLALITGIALSGVLVYQSSYAAFTSTTQNAGNSWSSGSVVLSDDDSGARLFDLSGIVPGPAAYRCITVRYAGDVGAAVKLYATQTEPPVTDLGPYLDITVDEGTGGDSGCVGFTPVTNLYAPGFDPALTLQTLGESHGSYESGLSSWTPAGPETRSYRIGYRLKDTNDAMGKEARITFVWEART